MPEGWYPHAPDHPFYELDWVFLHEHPTIPQPGEFGGRSPCRITSRSSRAWVSASWYLIAWPAS